MAKRVKRPKLIPRKHKAFRTLEVCLYGQVLARVEYNWQKAWYEVRFRGGCTAPFPSQAAAVAMMRDWQRPDNRDRVYTRFARGETTKWGHPSPQISRGRL
jgi:hypothetical protein